VTYTSSGPQEISLELNSSAIYKMGRIECVTRYNGLPPVIVQPDDNNRVAVRVDAASLPVGRCRGSVAVKLSALSPLLRDITGEFAFEVTLPAPPEKPFSPDALGGVWSGVLSYSAGGQSYRDSYTLNVYADGTCLITVTARDGEAQAAGGLWSESDGVLRIENCVFEAPAIARLPSLRWIGRYTLGNNNRRLSVNIKPAPDYSGVVGLVLNKER
jgi:hypothetical protein